MLLVENTNSEQIGMVQIETGDPSGRPYKGKDWIPVCTGMTEDGVYF